MSNFIVSTMPSVCLATSGVKKNLAERWRSLFSVTLLHHSIKSLWLNSIPRSSIPSTYMSPVRICGWKPKIIHDSKWFSVILYFLIAKTKFALNCPATQSSTYVLSGIPLVAGKAVDGNTASTASSTDDGDLQPWWKVHLTDPISRTTCRILTAMIATLLAPWREKADCDKWQNGVYTKYYQLFCILAENYLQFDSIELTSNIYLQINIPTGKSHMHFVCVKIREIGPFGNWILQILWQ